MNKKLVFDIAERAGWTFAQVAVGFVVAHQAGWPEQYASVIALGLSIVKGIIASHVGDPNTAATLPASLDPAAKQ